MDMNQKAPEKLNHIQKTWFLILFFMPMFYSVLFVVFQSCFKNCVFWEITKTVIENLWLMDVVVFGAFFGTLINLPIMFYCSYQKRGTILLTLSVYCSFFYIGKFIYDAPSIYSVFQNIYLLRKAAAATAEETASVLKYVLFFRFSTLGIAILWATYCWKLKHFYLQEHLQCLMGYKPYRKIFEELENIGHLDELTKFYSQSARENPLIEGFLAQKYKKRKRQLIPSQAVSKMV